MEASWSRILVTGGAGLIGSHIVDLLIAGELPCGRVVVIDNFARGRWENLARALPSGKVELLEGDIRDREFLARAMEGVDLVFHLAAPRITQCAEEPRLALEALVDGTFNVVEAAVAARVKKVVASSSASVYGLAEEFPTTESHHPYNNRTLYGAAKVFNEGLPSPWPVPASAAGLLAARPPFALLPASFRLTAVPGAPDTPPRPRGCGRAARVRPARRGRLAPTGVAERATVGSPRSPQKQILIPFIPLSPHLTSSWATGVARAERVADHELSFPMFPELAPEGVAGVVAAVTSAVC